MASTGASVKSCSCCDMPGKTERDREKRYRAENDVRTMKEAEIIKADKERFAAAMEVMDEEVKALLKISKGKE